MNMFTKSLYKVDLTGRTRIWTIEVEGNRYRTISGLIDGEKVTSEWSEAFGKNIGKVNGTTDEEQAMRVAETLIRIRKEQGCAESIEDAGKGKSWYQPMLAAKWKDVESKVTVDKDHPIHIQRKLDGTRCILSAEGMQSRTGKQFISAPHIYSKLKTLFERYPDLMLDGELYFHTEDDNFNSVISLVKKSKPTAEDLAESAAKIQYWVYDCPSCPGTWVERMNYINKLFAEEPELSDPSFVRVETYIVRDRSQIQEYLEKFVSEGYEGAIVRLDAPYENRRSKNLLKVKQFQDEEFPIIRIEEGRGNLSGKAGRIVVDVDGVEVAAGLKFSHEEATEIWEHRDYYVGKLATIKYFNKTEDGSLRFPKCIQIDRNRYE